MVSDAQSGTQAYDDAHHYADTDVEPSSIHHTLGKGMTQAAPGNHDHDEDYAPILHEHGAETALDIMARQSVGAPQNIVHDTFTKVTLGNVYLTGISLVSNSNCIEITEDAVYDCRGGLRYDTKTTGRRVAFLDHVRSVSVSATDGTRIIYGETNGGIVGGSSVYPTINLSRSVFLEAGDIVRLIAYQSNLDSSTVALYNAQTPAWLEVSRRGTSA